MVRVGSPLTDINCEHFQKIKLLKQINDINRVAHKGVFKPLALGAESSAQLEALTMTAGRQLVARGKDPPSAREEVGLQSWLSSSNYMAWSIVFTPGSGAWCSNRKM